MCGRFVLRVTPQQLAEFFALTREPHLTPRPNIAPTETVLAIIQDEIRGTLRSDEFRWGLIPSWSKDPRAGANLINARSETASTKPAFRNAFQRRRCLVPANGFYEWRPIPGQKKKRPYFIGLRHEPLIAFAGLWEHWSGEDGSSINSCTILTTTANSAVAMLHDRMPVILPPQEFDIWLNPAEDRAMLESLLRPYPADEMVLSAELADELLSGHSPPHQPTLF